MRKRRKARGRKTFRQTERQAMKKKGRLTDIKAGHLTDRYPECDKETES